MVNFEASFKNNLTQPVTLSRYLAVLEAIYILQVHQCLTFIRPERKVKALTETLHHKQPSKGFLRERCSENMQNIYRRTPIPKRDFNNTAKQLYWNHTSTWVFSCKSAAYFFKTPFLRTPLEAWFWRPCSSLLDYSYHQHSEFFNTIF